MHASLTAVRARLYLHAVFPQLAEVCARDAEARALVADWRTSIEFRQLGGAAAPKGFDLQQRMDMAMSHFPVLRKKAKQQASTLSGGEQKMLEIARGMMLQPKLVLIDEPSIGLSPILVEELFGLLRGMRQEGITVLMIEQNAKRALENSDFGVVLELGRTRIQDRADKILADPRIAQLFLGGGLEPAPA